MEPTRVQSVTTASAIAAATLDPLQGENEKESELHDKDQDFENWVSRRLETKTQVWRNLSLNETRILAAGPRCSLGTVCIIFNFISSRRSGNLILRRIFRERRDHSSVTGMLMIQAGNNKPICSWSHLSVGCANAAASLRRRDEPSSCVCWTLWRPWLESE